MKKLVVIAFALFIALPSCGSPSEALLESAQIRGAKKVDNQSDLPKCKKKAKGAVFYISSDDRFVYCDGKKYQDLELGGLDGQDGAPGEKGEPGQDGVNGQDGEPYVIETRDATEEECSEGGVVFSIGIDTDGNGKIDELTSTNTVCNDNCPFDPSKIVPGICGCGVADTDSDGDGTPDCEDNCPNDPSKSDPGQCGCGNTDDDNDEDGTADCNDQCPNDNRKNLPGTCGCGIDDDYGIEDKDGDGVMDCNDNCPDDPNKIEPGICGCCIPDTYTNGDGTIDCNGTEPECFEGDYGSNMCILKPYTCLIGDLRIGNSTLDLPNLKSISGNLEISWTGLTDFTGLEQLTFIGGELQIRINPSLPNCEICNLLGQLTDEPTSISLLGNLIDECGSHWPLTCSEPEPESNCILGNYQINNSFDVDILKPYSCITGDLEINAQELPILDLPNLESVSGNLSIGYSAALTSLTGLSGLTSVGGGLSINGAALTSLTGMERLTSIGGGLSIGNDGDRGTTLPNLTGLEGLTSIGGGLSISSNTALTSLTGLENLTSLGGELYFQYNESLTSLTGLGGLTSIGGGLSIHSNAALTNLTGLEGLTSVGGSFSIHRNTALSSLAGLEGLTSIGGGLSIYSNTALSICGVCPLLGQLSVWPAVIYVADNLIADSCVVIVGNWHLTCSDTDTGSDTGTDTGSDTDSTIGQTADNPALSCLEILASNPAANDGTYYIELLSGIYEMYCDFSSAGGGWTRVGALDGTIDYCGEITADLRQDPNLSAGKIPDDETRAVMTQTFESPQEVMFFVKDNARYFWHSLDYIDDFDTSDSHTSTDFYCTDWHCDNGTLESTVCGDEGDGCPITGQGLAYPHKKVYVDSSLSAHMRGLHLHGDFCGLPNYDHASIWVYVR